MDLKTRQGLVWPLLSIVIRTLKTQPNVNYPLHPVPKTPKQSPKNHAPPKKSENLKQTTWYYLRLWQKEHHRRIGVPWAQKERTEEADIESRPFKRHYHGG